MHITTKTAAIIIGVSFVITAILGFIPNPVVSPTGFFVVNTAHNLLHLIAGVGLLAAAFTAFGSGRALKIVGVVYGAVAILGFTTGNGLLLGTILVNHTGHWIHLIGAVIFLAAGFLLPDDKAATA